MSTERRTTIAFLADYMTQYLGAYEAQFRKAMAARCLELDINLLLVYGGALEHPSASSAAQNEIFELIHPDRVDGAILLSTSISSYSGPEKVRELVARFHGLPACSLGLALDGVPSVVIDNRSSMSALVDHLITAHGCRRIAFIGGTPENIEGQARHAAYCEVLHRHGIPFDPSLFAYGYFWSRGGREAMGQILERGVDFDAVVCANDLMVQSVSAVLRASGRRIPRDVAVTGFDDVHGSKLASPPLTTVAQPFEAMALRAIQLVLDQIQGRTVPLRTELRAELVIRRSCGCGLLAPRFNSQESAGPAAEAHRYLRAAHERIERRLHQEIHNIPDCEIEGAKNLLEALEAELSGKAGAFLEWVESIGEQVGRSPEYVLDVQRAFAFLRNELHSFQSLGIDKLWHEARDSIEVAIARSELRHREQMEDGYLRLLESSEEVSRALDRKSFRASLSKSLPLLRIQSGAISRYVDGNRDQLELMASLLDQKLQEDVPLRFPARQLMPPTSYPDNRRYTALVLPLLLESQRMGVAVFECNDDSMGQLMARTQISAALSSIHLHQEVIEQSRQNERGLQERIATSKRLEALSVLAGGVAHDLNNALGPLLALPDVILGELETDAGHEVSVELRRDVEMIKSAALRAAQTIKDLLTLGRQGRTAKEVVDVVAVIKTCISTDLPRLTRGISPLVNLRIEVPDVPLGIFGSEAHIARAIANLVHNAAEAIAGTGEVLVEARAIQISVPTQGFELIEPGDYVALTVADTGGGLPATDLHRIFEPFFSSKRASDHSGSGLGLAIVHSVVKEHDGYIDVTSRPGLGTTFTLYFPRADVAVGVVAQPMALSKVGQGRILIVDDEPIQLRTGRRVLSRLGYQIDTLESGRLAIERLSQAAQSGKSPYDLVILDMILNEELDGLDRFEQIRQLFPLQRAIVVSGHAPTERAEAAFRKGLTWLAKPYTADTLASVVQVALAEGDSQSPQRVSCRPSVVPPKAGSVPVKN